MLRILLMGLLLIGPLARLCAQTGTECAQTEAIFQTPNDLIDRRFHIDLGKGNKLTLELNRIEVLDRFDNVDSVLLGFMADIKPLQDSLAEPLTGKHIEYLVDSAGRKKIRIRQTRPAGGTSYLIDNQGLASLRLQQDTIVMTFRDPLVRMTFCLNEWNELTNYVTDGLSQKFRFLRKTDMKDWGRADFCGVVHNFKDQSITAERDAGFAHLPNDRLETILRVNLQNYQNFFVPSLSLGMEAILSTHMFHPRQPSVGQETIHLSLAWEPMFFFAATPQTGKMQIQRTDMLEFSYSLEEDWNRAKSRGGRVNFVPAFSMAWPIYRQGDYIDQHAYRVSAGKFKIWGNTALLEPCIWYHDFFRNVTPAARLSINF